MNKKKEKEYAKNSLPKLEEMEGAGFCRTYRYGNRSIKFMCPGKADCFEYALRTWKSKYVPKICGRVEDIIVMQWVDGKTINKPSKKQLIEIGKALKSLHQNVKGYGRVTKKGFEFKSFKEWVKNEVKEIKKELKGKERKAIGRWYNLIKNFNPIAVMTHGDFGKKHVIWKNGKISGMIDFENAQGAPAEMDIGRLRYEMHTFQVMTEKELEYLMKGYSKKVNWKLVDLIESYYSLKGLDFLRKVGPKFAKNSKRRIKRILGS